MHQDAPSPAPVALLMSAWAAARQITAPFSVAGQKALPLLLSERAKEKERVRARRKARRGSPPKDSTCDPSPPTGGVRVRPRGAPRQGGVPAASSLKAGKVHQRRIRHSPTKAERASVARSALKA